ncbi:DUF397 domain-containing protein [Actinomadura sp. WMMB 499]|uniref:DUF397 domain-containing protein n=1 Tax=Actinomadura sp. WMMB 499 TaxID=1219491 RepID=UPI0012462BF0|nr:DUF397 domain-containing protein [Actinomadura sp. WMMB 499]
MDLSNAAWRKANRSTENGGNCIEVADVPSAVWRKAKRSAEHGGNCVELASARGAVAVRDSKDPDGPKIFVSRSAFRRLTETLKATG